jgi:hypothetical protein
MLCKMFLKTPRFVENVNKQASFSSPELKAH